MAIATINPATGETLETFEPLSELEIDRRLQNAANAFQQYRRMPIAERARRMMQAAQVLEQRREDFARIATTEMGKPIQALPRRDR